MKKLSTFLSILILVLSVYTSSQAQCPEEPNDLGICDTLYIQCLDCDLVEGSPPWNVHILLLITHDLSVSTDSIQEFRIPISYDGDCTFLPDSNTNDLSGPGLSTSIFRDFGGMENRMLDLQQLGGGESWDTRIIDIDNPQGRFSLSLLASADQDQEWWEGSGVLLATLTLTVTDPTIAHIELYPDTTFAYVRSGRTSYEPRLNIPDPGCFYIRLGSGDTNSDGHLGLGDVVYLVNYLYRYGPAPEPLLVGDVNGDFTVDLGDVIYLLTYLCRGGLPPEESCSH